MCFFNDTATTEIYTLSLHDALPIFTPEPLVPDYDGACLSNVVPVLLEPPPDRPAWLPEAAWGASDRKSTRLNSSHANISYAVFCLKKKKIHRRVLRLRGDDETRALY